MWWNNFMASRRAASLARTLRRMRLPSDGVMAAVWPATMKPQPRCWRGWAVLDRHGIVYRLTLADPHASEALANLTNIGWSIIPIEITEVTEDNHAA